MRETKAAIKRHQNAEQGIGFEALATNFNYGDNWRGDGYVIV